MANKMLIDATHPEETRVAVVRGNRIEEFDFESASKKPLKGNIYLAKVIRVEPSLQAAFVEYGGNRHGFLAFSEIHPDYYQIPVADRQRLIEEHARLSAEADEEEDRPKRSSQGNGRNRSRSRVRNTSGEQTTAEVTEAVEGIEVSQENAPQEEAQQQEAQLGHDDDHHDEGEDSGVDSDEMQVEQVNTNSDALDEIPDRQIRRMLKSYKIQEVIKKRQVMLIQVVKEERGNKGAALTTYLSLAGRYAVLMPNTARGGGISRKIGSGEDRKRLKEVAEELEVPDGMGLIIRTAGAQRTKVEIKRDYDYLLRVWDTVRDLTLASSAPALVYEEGSLIKRSIRDLYGKDIDEVIVEGEDAYREAKDFMKMLMPSHSKNVQNYKENIPLFAKYGVESQLEVMFQNQVSLRSGGYLVINQTEALVAIDVNSGRSTKEHNIEDTALKTNLEAADEVARQLRLRDLAGLVVIDFIDMEDNRNDRAVERRLKDALNQDRARIQVGRISPFGLMEMSRQRLRTSVLESTTVQCPHCTGLGYVRATASTALLILRGIEAALIKDARLGLTVRTKAANALYLLNQKRSSLNELEARYGVHVLVEADEGLASGVNYIIDRTALFGDEAIAVAAAQQQRTAAHIATTQQAGHTGRQSLFPDANANDDGEEDAEAASGNSATPTPAAEGEEAPRRKRRRRRNRGRGRREEGTEPQLNADGSVNESAEEGDDEDDFVDVEPTDGVLFAPKPILAPEVVDAAPAPLLQMSAAQPAFRRPRPPRPDMVEAQAEGEASEAPAPRQQRDQFGRPRFRKDRAAEATPAESVASVDAVVEPIVEAAPAVPAKPARKPRETAAQKAAALEAKTAQAEPVVEKTKPVAAAKSAEPVMVVSFAPTSEAQSDVPEGERKKGWWSKKILG